MKSKNSIFRSLRDNNEGGVLIMAAFFIVVLFALGGAGIDFGRAYLLKMKSQQASDAAALAAANPAIKDPTEDQRIATANMYYNLNFPETYLGVKRPPLNVTPNALNITVGNSADMNTNFIRTMGSQFNKLNVSSQSKVDIGGSNPKYDVILVLDTSDSMDWTFEGKKCGSNGSVTPTCNNGEVGNTSTNYCYNSAYNYYSCGSASRLSGLKTASKTLVNQLISNVALENNNLVSIILWNNTFRRMLDFTNNDFAANSYINSTNAIGGTNSTTGLAKAREVGNKNFRSDAARVVVLLTDGMNTGTSSPAKHDPDIDSATLKLCSEFKNDKPIPTVVYTIAVGDIVKKDASGNFTAEGKIVNDLMSKCASGSPDSNLNQYYFIVSDNASQLNNVFKTIADNVQKLRITD